MGNVHAHRGRLTLALMLLLVVATLALSAALVTENASATQTWTCGSCHNYTGPGDAFHARTTHAAQTCAKCHVNGPGAAGLLPSACASCHGPATTIIAARAQHGTAGCSTCHTAPSPSPTPTATSTPTPTPSATAVATTMTLKAAPTIVRVTKSVKVTGTARPLPALAGAKVALKVQRKVGTKWVKMKAVTKTVSAAGAFSWTYKTVKKGPHRVTATIAKTSTHTKKSLIRTFRVK